ncbi:MAG: beta-ketoacyl-ACP synthase III [Rhodomicrobium sp.]
MKKTRSVVAGCGAYLPAKILTNADLARMVDTSDEWITERTGIKARHIAADGEKTSDLGLAAAIDALNNAGLEPSSIDFIVLATSTPDHTFPATAVAIQAALGITSGFAFDLQAVCSGFVYALNTADNFLRAGQGKRALVIGAETFSRILDWEDRSTCVLFGDGAGAVVLEACEVKDPMRERCIIGSLLRSDGRHREKLYVDGGPSATQTVGHLRMQGKEVFRFAVNAIAEVVEESLAANNLRPSDIDWFVPHQANQRILDGTAKKVGIPPEKVVITLDRHGNTSAASIPLALVTAVRDGRIKRGDLILLEAMGGGFTWGANLIRW